MKNKMIIIIILVNTIFIIMLYNFLLIKYKKQKQEVADNYTAESLASDQNETITVPVERKQEKTYPKEEIIKEYNGYEVCARLQIPKIELETYVLKEYSTQALNVSVTKFWGADPNQIGNCCIAGHNFVRKNMFRNLKKLEVGDKIIVTDNSVGIIEYEIYDIFQVYPKNVDCLDQETNGKREITLITCTSDSKKRIIVKAREIWGRFSFFL